MDIKHAHKPDSPSYVHATASVKAIKECDKKRVKDYTELRKYEIETGKDLLEEIDVGSHANLKNNKKAVGAGGLMKAVTVGGQGI